ncbi:MAG TPA: Ig-like domain-containing protein, partial [Caldilineaceae bacterium]|nr:Ig-like domain-containing protein [Caldilineaceae bacterium]
GSTTHPTRFMVAAPHLASRQDSYGLVTLTSNSTAIGGQGDLRRNLLPGGQANTLFTSSTGGPLMGNTAPDIACNNSGTCIVVWHQRGFSSTTNDYVRYAIIQPDGSQVCCFAVNSFVQAFRPAVATDGVNFMVAYVLSETSGGTSMTNIVMRRYNSLGNPLSGGGSWSIPVGQIGSGDIALDLVYANDHYVMAVKRNSAGPIMNRRIQIGTFTKDGVYETEAGAPVLAQNSVTGQTLLLYRGSVGEVRFRLADNGTFHGIDISGVDFTLNDPPGSPIMGSKLSATHDPRTNEWLITVDGRVRIFDQWLNPVLPVQDVAPGNQVALACPAPVSLPVRDLRFEEFPGATDFGGAGCSGNNCPAAGLPGATDNQGNAIGGGPLGPASDYSIQFDGIDDELSMSNPLGDEFSLAFWYKATGGASSTPFSIESNQPAGFGLFIYNTLGVTEFFVGNTSSGRIAVSQGLADGQWHFVVATRASSGATALYLDGNPTPVASAASSPTPAMGSSIQIRDGNRSAGLDNLQLYKVALPGETVEALYKRTSQSYCVGVEGYRWTRINATSPDTRGGKVTASGSLVLTVDRDLPTATIVGLTNDQYIPGNTVRTIGGNANDPTSSVARVEVSVNAGPWQAASGAESWAYNLNLAEGGYSIRVRAIDAVGNVGNASSALSVVADAAPPVVTLNAIPAAPRLPTRNANGQWQTTLNGAVSDLFSGIPADGVEVLLQGQGDALGNGWQNASHNGNDWNIAYLFAPGLPDPTGAYTVSVRAVDTVGNRTAGNIATGILRLDAPGPGAALSGADSTPQVISETLTIRGLITETGPSGQVAGLDKLEIAFVSVEAIAALPTDATATEADGLLNRTWLPASLAQRGAGIGQSSWSVAIPAGLENEYQIDLRATDMLGNVLVPPCQRPADVRSLLHLRRQRPLSG